MDTESRLCYAVLKASTRPASVSCHKRGSALAVAHHAGSLVDASGENKQLQTCSELALTHNRTPPSKRGMERANVEEGTEYPLGVALPLCGNFRDLIATYPLGVHFEGILRGTHHATRDPTTRARLQYGVRHVLVALPPARAPQAPEHLLEGLQVVLALVDLVPQKATRVRLTWGWLGGGGGNYDRPLGSMLQPPGFLR